MSCFNKPNIPFGHIIIGRHSEITLPRRKKCAECWPSLRLANFPISEGNSFDHANWKSEPNAYNGFSLFNPRPKKSGKKWHRESFFSIASNDNFSPRKSILFHNCFAIEFRWNLRNISRSLIVSGPTLCSLCSFCRKWFRYSLPGPIPCEGGGMLQWSYFVGDALACCSYHMITLETNIELVWPTHSTVAAVN